MTVLDTGYTISLYKGQSKNFRLFVLDKKTRKPVNLTGATIYLTVKGSIGTSENILQKVSTDIVEIEIDQPLAGQAIIHFNPVDTLNLDCRDYVYDVWVILATGARHLPIPPSKLTVQATVGVIAI